LGRPHVSGGLEPAEHARSLDEIAVAKGVRRTNEDRRQTPKRKRKISREPKRNAERFVLVPIGDLLDDTVFALIGLADRHGGRLHSDGRITLGDAKAWPHCLKQAREMGLTFAKSARQSPFHRIQLRDLREVRTSGGFPTTARVTAQSTGWRPFSHSTSTMRSKSPHDGAPRANDPATQSARTETAHFSRSPVQVRHTASRDRCRSMPSAMRARVLANDSLLRRRSPRGESVRVILTIL